MNGGNAKHNEAHKSKSFCCRQLPHLASKKPRETPTANERTKRSLISFSSDREVYQHAVIRSGSLHGGNRMCFGRNPEEPQCSLDPKSPRGGQGRKERAAKSRHCRGYVAELLPRTFKLTVGLGDALF